jgi:VanZ family protein
VSPGRRSALSWLAAVAYCGVIFALSAMENPLPAITGRISDKVLHAVEYAGLGGLLGLALAASAPRLRPLHLFLAAALGAAAYGASDEWHQSFVPGRDMSALDWLADATGATLGAGAAVAFLRRARSAG